MPEFAKIMINNQTYEFPVIEGNDGTKSIDITTLRSSTGCLAYDPGFANIAACKSSITYLDGEKGILRYRGYPIEQIAENATFVETAYLLIHGELPTKDQLRAYSRSFTRHANLHEDMKAFFIGYPATGHPMAMVSAMVCALSAYYPELVNPHPTDDDIETTSVELLAKVRTIAACTYKKRIGEPFMYAKSDLEYMANFLHMMFSTPTSEYTPHPTVLSALRTLMILHADHEQNCSTSTVRLVGSSWANLFASVSAGICALWGPLHGGANQQVVEMLEKIQKDGGNVDKYIEMAKNPTDPFRLMGFGHRVYKSYDPRARIIKQKAHDMLSALGIHDPLLEIAVKLEEKVLKDPYFIERKLYPNVDFYSGLIYKAIGIPTDMFTVMFVIGRLPGWIAHWIELKKNKEKIGRPRQIFTGELIRDFVPIDKRK